MLVALFTSEFSPIHVIIRSKPIVLLSTWVIQFDWVYFLDMAVVWNMEGSKSLEFGAGVGIET